MGKAEDELPLSITGSSEEARQNVDGQCGSGCAPVRKFFGLRCILVLLISTAALLSALFWLPPFLRYADQEDLDPDIKYKDHDIVASFVLKRPVSLFEDNSVRLAADIFDEIGVPSTKVVILSVEPSQETNHTKVVFGFDPDVEHSEMSSAAKILIKLSFESLVTNQSFLQLTESLFGDPSYFEVIKFQGGITIIPPQSVFLLQKVQVSFNFTLIFSIYQLQENFDELRSQLKSGLNLAPYENLYIRLSNLKGSTVAAPAIVNSSVLLMVGNTPSTRRLKQLAQTITDSHSRNLGLNNTVFGKVRQVRLSSVLQHSLHRNDGSGTAWSPSPTPLPHPPKHHHHHHHHHHHPDPVVSPSPSPSIHENANPPKSDSFTWTIASPHHHPHHLDPVVSLSPSPSIHKNANPPKSDSFTWTIAPAPFTNPQGRSPNCQFGKAKSRSHVAPSVGPSVSLPLEPTFPPQQKAVPPALVPRGVPASSPLPHVVFTRAEHPSKTESAAPHSDTHFAGPSPSPSSVARISTQWACSLMLCLMMQL